MSTPESNNSAHEGPTSQYGVQLLHKELWEKGLVWSVTKSFNVDDTGNKMTIYFFRLTSNTLNKQPETREDVGSFIFIQSEQNQKLGIMELQHRSFTPGLTSSAINGTSLLRKAEQYLSGLAQAGEMHVKEFQMDAGQTSVIEWARKNGYACAKKALYDELKYAITTGGNNTVTHYDTLADIEPKTWYVYVRDLRQDGSHEFRDYVFSKEGYVSFVARLKKVAPRYFSFTLTERKQFWDDVDHKRYDWCEAMKPKHYSVRFLLTKKADLQSTAQ